ncbi:DnaA regulatory inactivator Hda [Neptunomonas antarctica]|uniref:Regulatory inactivation of DnaA Hda protein n=1 Tax=Neptunomonas antarctica TaxID=619304 RepID=A0A1N7LQ50_9GAMM|nr:DnaA regulatory inactivator Hda [Neptunomonas antarctica]SIS75948.1 regulatory inactivation of DnaA Hda protein [Neptunomonas antarctica]
MSSANAPQQLPLGVTLRDAARFANFQTGSNGLVCEMLRQAAVGEGESFLYIWGAKSSGCSHLLQAACHAAEPRKLTAVYLPLNELMSLSPVILEGMEYLDLICVDNIEAVANKPEWEEALFHLYNRIRQEQNTLIVAANSAPRQLKIKLPDLVSRLSWGAVFNVTALNDDDKVQAIQLRAKIRGIELPEEVAKYLVHHASRSMNDLCLMLDRLDKASLRAQRKVTIPFIKQEMGW